MDELMTNYVFWSNVVQTLIIVAGFCILKFNDLKHLSIKVSDISKDVKINTKKLNRIDKKVAVSEKAITILESEKK